MKKKDETLKLGIRKDKVRAETNKNSLDQGEEAFLDEPGLQGPD